MEEQLISIGFLVVIIGIVIIIIGSVLSASKSKTKVEWGFGALIGFIPIGFWSSKRMMYLVITVLIIFSILFLILGRRLIL